MPTDFGAFCEDAVIRTKAGGKIRFRPDVWHNEQRRYYEEKTRRDIILKPRQIGFSTFCLAEDLHFAITREGVNVLVVSHADVEQLFMTIRIMADHLREAGKLPKPRRDNVRELSFEELGSSIRVVEAGTTAAAAAKRGRSGTIHRLHVTELAFWGAPAETMNALEAAAGQAESIVVESTPNGAGGLFYDMVMAARSGIGDYRLHFYPWFDHEEYRRAPSENFDPLPRDATEERLREAGCDDAQIAWWRAQVDNPAVGLDKALQEYPLDPETCFRASGRGYIDASIVDQLSARTTDPMRREPLYWQGRYLGDLLVWEEPRPGVEYVVGGDVAEGIGNDGSSATVMEVRSGQVVATLWSDAVEAGDFGLALAAMGYRYNEAEVAPERNNHGHAAIRALEHEVRYPNVYRHDDRRSGWPTSPSTRPVLFDDLRRAVSESTWTPDAAAVSEARTLIIDEDGRPRARNKGKADGCRDDRWVSWAIAHQVRSRAKGGGVGTFRFRLGA